MYHHIQYCNVWHAIKDISPYFGFNITSNTFEETNNCGWVVEKMKCMVMFQYSIWCMHFGILNDAVVFWFSIVTRNLMYVQNFRLRRKSHSLLDDPRIDFAFSFICVLAIHGQIAIN